MTIGYDNRTILSVGASFISAQGLDHPGSPTDSGYPNRIDATADYGTLSPP